MRLAECPVVEFSQAFAELGLSLSHVVDNTFLLVGPGGFEVTTFQMGEALGNGRTVRQAARLIVEEHKAATKPPAPKKTQLPPKEYV